MGRWWWGSPSLVRLQYLLFFLIASLTFAACALFFLCLRATLGVFAYISKQKDRVSNDCSNSISSEFQSLRDVFEFCSSVLHFLFNTK